jgi:hypothetical protein
MEESRVERSRGRRGVARFRKMMFEELERRNYSAGTTGRYLRFVVRFAHHFGKPPDKLGPEHLRTYHCPHSTRQ